MYVPRYYQFNREHREAMVDLEIKKTMLKKEAVTPEGKKLVDLKEFMNLIDDSPAQFSAR